MSIIHWTLIISDCLIWFLTINTQTRLVKQGLALHVGWLLEVLTLLDVIQESLWLRYLKIAFKMLPNWINVQMWVGILLFHAVLIKQGWATVLYLPECQIRLLNLSKQFNEALSRDDLSILSFKHFAPVLCSLFKCSVH